MKIHLTLAAILLLFTQAMAQNTISGIIKDKATSQPIPGANIYMNNSQIGTTSGKDGTFSLSIPASGKVSLFFSHVGYKTVRQSIISADSLFLTVLLAEDELQLTEYKISSSSDKKWERQLRRFQSLFLGTDRFSRTCKILNPWVLEFDDYNGVFTAKSNQVLKVRNEATGYLVTYYLLDFYSRENLISYKGMTSFEELEPSSLNEYNEWQANRQSFYNGSFRHFLKSVVEDKMEENGFEATFIYDIEGDLVENTSDPLKVKDRKVGDSTIFMNKDGRRFLNFARYLQIQYFGNEPGERNQTSTVDLVTPTEVNQLGVMDDPSSIIAYGNMSKENFAYLLPVEYVNQPNSNNLLKFNKSVIRPFTNYTALHPTEKLHVHTDRDLYVDEEIIWFKAYASINNQPSNLSNKLYMQLQAQDSSIAKLIVPVKDGLAVGSIAIPKELPTGEYMLKAYTNWTDSLGDHYHFNKQLKIGIDESEEVAIKGNVEPKLIVNVYPEGGHLVEGVDNRVAFEVKNQGNQFVNTTLELYNGQGKKLQTISPGWQGKGTFDFKPQRGKSYVLKSAMDPTLEVSLEVTESLDMSMVLLEKKQSLNVEVRSSNKEEKPVYLLVTANEQVIDFQSVQMKDKETFKIERSALKDGINQITLFNYQYEPLAERLYFKIPEYKSDIRLEIANVAATKRSQSVVTISGSDSIRSASLSVINSNLTYSSEEDNIFVSTYLRPYILGNVVGLDTEFQDSEVTKKQLDLLMMVNGWRKYSWSDIRDAKMQSDTLSLPNGFDINGRLTNGRKKEAVPGEVVFLVVNDSTSALYETVTDTEGYFTFEDVVFTDSTDLVFKILKNGKGKNDLNFEFEESQWNNQLAFVPTAAAAGTVVAAEQKNKLNRKELLTISKFEGRTYYLKDAVIKARSINDEPMVPRIYSSPNGKVLHLDDLEPGQKNNVFTIINLNFPNVRAVVANNTGASATSNEEIVPGLIYSIAFGNNISTKGNDQMFIMIDNVPATAETLSLYNPLEIESIEIQRGVDAAILGPNSGNGVVLIYTKRGKTLGSGKAPNFAQKRLKGYQDYKEFYAPDHTVLLDNSPDYRTTVYWNPSISDENRVLKFSNSDVKGKIQVILEGYTTDGRPFRSTDFYEVGSSE